MALLFVSSGFTARILRAVRIAARLGLRFSRDIALCVRELSGSVLRLDKVLQTIVLVLWFYNHFQFIISMFKNVVGKNSHGNELYAGIWVCRGFFEVIMEVWAP